MARKEDGAAETGRLGRSGTVFTNTVDGRHQSPRGEARRIEMDLTWQSEDAGAGKALHVHCGHRDVIKTTRQWRRTARKTPCPSRMGNDLLLLVPGAQEDKCTVWLSD